jgi:hypothetical protein
VAVRPSKVRIGPAGEQEEQRLAGLDHAPVRGVEQRLPDAGEAAVAGRGGREHLSLDEQRDVADQRLLFLVQEGAIERKGCGDHPPVRAGSAHRGGRDDAQTGRPVGGEHVVDRGHPGKRALQDFPVVSPGFPGAHLVDGDAPGPSLFDQRDLEPRDLLLPLPLGYRPSQQPAIEQYLLPGLRQVAVDVGRGRDELAAGGLLEVAFHDMPDDERQRDRREEEQEDEGGGQAEGDPAPCAGSEGNPHGASSGNPVSRAIAYTFA